MEEPIIYTTAEMCRVLGVSKSTLFRWEEEEWFPSVGRDVTGQRQYTSAHVEAVRLKKLREQFDRAFDQADDFGDERALHELHETLALRKFLEGDVTGLYEIAEIPDPSNDTVVQLVEAALRRYEPGSDLFCEALAAAIPTKKLIQIARRILPSAPVGELQPG